MYCSESILPSILTNRPVPYQDIYPQILILPPPNFTVPPTARASCSPLYPDTLKSIRDCTHGNWSGYSEHCRWLYAMGSGMIVHTESGQGTRLVVCMISVHQLLIGFLLDWSYAMRCMISVTGRLVVCNGPRDDCTQNGQGTRLAICNELSARFRG